ncbi:MAG: rhamnulokinase [Bacteroidales bacterium]|nr:rhamnulokinase [Bacteroidales bacterium]
MKHFIAVDFGATSGRVMLASLGGQGFALETLHRFPTPLLEKDGRYHWDLEQMCDSVVEGLRVAGERGVSVTSIGIDTWGVDFARFDADGALVDQPRSYRDPYTAGVPDRFFAEMPREALFRRTGIQIMDFNSVFQFYAQKGQYPATEYVLFLPDAIGYLLTGEKVTEKTILSTASLTRAGTARLDPEVCALAGVAPEMFGRIVEPGYRLGVLKPEMAGRTGLGPVPVITVAGHDTASAIVAVPAADPHFAYLSSGTWSLMGIETKGAIVDEDSSRLNFTNEGGVEGTTRFLKNITGMWLLEQCRRVWKEEGKDYSYETLVEMARAEAAFQGRIDPDDPRFAHPGDMVAEITAALGQYVTDAQMVSCIYHSLAGRYRDVLAMLQGFAPFRIDQLHIIGGGSANALLNQWTADAIGLPVVAGPVEATAIGNVMVQAKAAGLLSDRWDIRRLIAKTFPVETFMPRK